MMADHDAELDFIFPECPDYPYMGRRNMKSRLFCIDRQHRDPITNSPALFSMVVSKPMDDQRIFMRKKQARMGTTVDKILNLKYEPKYYSGSKMKVMESTDHEKRHFFVSSYVDGGRDIRDENVEWLIQHMDSKTGTENEIINALLDIDNGITILMRRDFNPPDVERKIVERVYKKKNYAPGKDTWSYKWEKKLVIPVVPPGRKRIYKDNREGGGKIGYPNENRIIPLLEVRDKDVVTDVVKDFLLGMSTNWQFRIKEGSDERGYMIKEQLEWVDRIATHDNTFARNALLNILDGNDFIFGNNLRDKCKVLRKMKAGASRKDLTPDMKHVKERAGVLFKELECKVILK